LRSFATSLVLDLETVHEFLETCDGFAVGAVTHPRAIDLADDKAGLLEDFQML
jgi:hypothetical protein